MKIRLKINGVIIVTVLLLIATFPSLAFRREYAGPLDEVAEVFGIAFILLGQIFRLSARGYKSDYSHQGDILIQDGPYALVRNPMYLGIILIGLGIVLMLFQWWLVVGFLLIFILRYQLLILEEEKKLKSIFPLDYPDYQRKVPCILPSLSAMLNKDIGEYLPIRVSWLKKEISTILAVLLIVLFIESWEDIKTEGFGVYLKESAAMGITIILFIFLAIYLNKRTVNYGPSKINNHL